MKHFLYFDVDKDKTLNPYFQIFLLFPLIFRHNHPEQPPRGTPSGRIAFNQGKENLHKEAQTKEKEGDGEYFF